MLFLGFMKAQVIASLLAIVGCTTLPPANPSSTSSAHGARGQYLSEQYTPTETASPTQQEGDTTTNNPSAQVPSTTVATHGGDEASRYDGDGPTVHAARESVAPPEQPVFSPRLVNTGDPCGWCR
jgi:hypothetical protein